MSHSENVSPEMFGRCIERGRKHVLSLLTEGYYLVDYFRDDVTVTWTLRHQWNHNEALVVVDRSMIDVTSQIGTRAVCGYVDINGDIRTTIPA